MSVREPRQLIPDPTVRFSLETRGARDRPVADIPNSKRQSTKIRCGPRDASSTMQNLCNIQNHGTSPRAVLEAE